MIESNRCLFEIGEKFIIRDDPDELETKPALLLHSCCGPCSTAVVERLAGEFDITVFFYNPCITDEDEYMRRRAAQLEFIEKFNRENAGKTRIRFTEGSYRPSDFFEMVKGLEKEPEGGARCRLCFRQRLETTAEVASMSGYDHFGTTLTVSPHKDAALDCGADWPQGTVFPSLTGISRKRTASGDLWSFRKSTDCTGRITADAYFRREKGRNDMHKLIIPKNYTPFIDYMESQRAIKKIKDFFQLSWPTG